MESSSSEDEDTTSWEVVLMTANGTVILNWPLQTSESSEVLPWIIEIYMATFVSCGVPVKLGIGFTSKVCCFIVLIDNK